MIRTEYMSFEDWSSAFIQEEAIQLQPFPEDKWKEWASYLLELEPRYEGLPRPDNFKTWQEWALAIQEELV